MTVGPAGDARIAAGFATGSEYVALIKTDGNEVSGGGYQRQLGAFDQSTEQGATDAIVNTAEIDFGTATATWGTVNKYRLYTSSSSTAESNLLYEWTVSNVTINANAQVTFGVGGLRMNIV